MSDINEEANIDRIEYPKPELTYGSSEVISPDNYVSANTYLQLLVKVKHLENKILELEEWKETNKATEIHETCTNLTLKENDLLKSAFCKIHHIYNSLQEYDSLDKMLIDTKTIIDLTYKELNDLKPKINKIEFNLEKIMEADRRGEK